MLHTVMSGQSSGSFIIDKNEKYKCKLILKLKGTIYVHFSAVKFFKLNELREMGFCPKFNFYTTKITNFAEKEQPFCNNFMYSISF